MESKRQRKSKVIYDIKPPQVKSVNMTVTHKKNGSLSNSQGFFNARKYVQHNASLNHGLSSPLTGDQTKLGPLIDKGHSRPVLSLSRQDQNNKISNRGNRFSISGATTEKNLMKFPLNNQSKKFKFFQEPEH
jgi:hypothetical protein